MSVAGRMTTGTTLLILLLVAVLVYHQTVVRDLTAVHRELSTHHVRAVMLALEQVRLVEQMEEAARKLAVTADAGYARKLLLLAGLFEQRLTELRALALGSAERATLSRAAAGWVALRSSLPAPEKVTRRASPAAREKQLAESLGRLAAVRLEIGRLIEASQQTVERRVERSIAARDDAERVALWIFAIAFALGVVALLLTIGSIHRPLRRLIDATGQVADENFGVRLEPTSGDEFAGLTAAFNAMVRRLGELDGMKKRLLSHVSHELRTPLTSIQESHQLLLEELPGPLTSSQRGLLELNVGSCRRLSRMLSELLDLSRLEAGAAALDLREWDVRALATQAAGLFEARVHEAGLALSADLPARGVNVRCDGERLLQVLSNLLDNACKLSPRGGRITVRARAVDRPPDPLPRAWQAAGLDGAHFALLEVTDEGPGVPPQERSRIFERFHQAHRQPYATGGVGLGLAICREIVSAHHGCIWVTGRARGGSRFRVLLPKVATEAGEAATSGALDPVNGAHRTLAPETSAGLCLGRP